MSSNSNLLSRLAAIMKRQQQQQRGLVVEDEEDIDAHYTLTEAELEEAQRRFWARISGSHEMDGPISSPKVLETCDLKGVAEYLKGNTGYGNGKRQVVVMVGAGISTSAGIPDFRSPKTGLYANLARLNLPYPEAVFDIMYFKENPLPFYTLANELYPGKFRPTITHSFIKLLADKDMLHMCFTQNIDTLERLAGVPASKLVEAHGSFAENHCVDCGTKFPSDEMRELVMTPNPAVPGGVNVPKCKIKGCGGLVKPDIVFFGESLPERFHQSLKTLPFADLAIVMGTSLKVHPFARLPEMVSDRCPRVLMNMEAAGGFGRGDDVIHLAPCDDAVRELCDLLGWRDELEATWAATEGLIAGPPISRPVASQSESKVKTAKKVVETGGMKDLAQMMAERLNLNADSPSAQKNAGAVAESIAAVTDPVDTPPASALTQRKATASTRVSLSWVPNPAPVPDEDSVLVLTALTGHYVDVRIKLSSTMPQGDLSTITAPLSESPINDPQSIPSSATLSWAFAGMASRTPDGKGGRWSRVIDSRTPVIDSEGEIDEGQEEMLPNGDTKEWGTMGGKDYVEIWRRLDIGELPETWVSEKAGAGMVVQVGEWAQGVARTGENLGVFRAHRKGDEWEYIYSNGLMDQFPAIGGSKDGWKVVSNTADVEPKL
ncbi:NAD-dependent histone deacetylase SIR2 [Ceratobasidium theobromae]|uniref:NAD-dependent histone deacetylase SIR2 n=1 Tax=Ceratobasidium theobromae TaxID=1582974 RepID=A0A5N5QER7_9AGAM|nr:NAD-dependent histone deacetylase SIR2 [Ceratobasidium theobromae]